MNRRQYLMAGARTVGVLTASQCLLVSARAAALNASHAPRIVSLSGGMTEVLWRLNAQDLVVATDTTSTYPSAAMHTPKVGYMRQLSAEGILALRPSVVLGTHEVGPPSVLAQLQSAGVQLLLAKADHSFNELLSKVRLASQASGYVSQGKALEAELIEQWQHALSTVARNKLTKPPRALFVMNHGGRVQSAGQGTAAHNMLQLAGAVNALFVDQGYKALSSEAVAKARPDVIVTTTESIQASGGAEKFWQQPGLAFTPAAQRQALISMDAMALLGFGPRLPASLLTLHEQLYQATSSALS